MHLLVLRSQGAGRSLAMMVKDVFVSDVRDGVDFKTQFLRRNRTPPRMETRLSFKKNRESPQKMGRLRISKVSE